MIAFKHPTDVVLVRRIVITLERSKL